MEGHLEVLLELYFFTKPLKFGVETHMEAPTRVALTWLRLKLLWLWVVPPPPFGCVFF
jgi:hypothetical protein